ncbi:MAG: phage major capsid protein, partial [Parvularcula sp.]|nr:phage major capsid protein [Parvularcula sp.]
METKTAILAGAAALATGMPEYGQKDAGGGDDGIKLIKDDGSLDLKALGTALTSVKEQVGGLSEKVEEEQRKGNELSTTMKSSVDEALTKLGVLDEIKARVDEIEQKSLRDGEKRGSLDMRSWGQQIAESEEVKALADRKAQSAKVEIDLKAITSASGDAGGLMDVHRDPDVVKIPQRQDVAVRDLLTVVPTSDGAIEFAKQTLRTNNAAPVAEGAAKPYSDYGWTKATTNAITIAHLAKVTRQALQDAPRLQAEVDSEMRYGLKLAEDDQLLNGDGTGENLDGLIANATDYAAAFALAGGNTMIDTLRLAMLQVAKSNYVADGMVLSHDDWARIELMKTDDGAYLFANPTQLTGPVLWGRRVVPTLSMTIDKFLVGNFRMAATIYDRMSPEVLISSENADDFEKNLLTMRAEERIALAVKRALALIYGDFGNV